MRNSDDLKNLDLDCKSRLLLSPIWNKSKIILHEFLLGILAIIGIGVAFWEETENLWAIALGLLSSMFAVVFSLINAGLVKKNPPARIAFYELLVGVISLGIYISLTGRWKVSPWNIQVSDWIYLSLLAMFCTTFAFVNSIKVMRHLSPYTTMLVLNLEPIYGVILAFFVLGEDGMSSRFYIGMMITILAVFGEVIIMKNKNQKKIIMQ